MKRLGQSAVAVAASYNQVTPAVRHYEYWGLHTTPRAQPGTVGETLLGTMQLLGTDRLDKEAQYLTGNGLNRAWTTELVNDRVAENHMVKTRDIFFKGIDKYILDTVSEKECALVAGILEGADTSAVWARLFRLFPMLKTPLNEETQKAFEEWYIKLVAVAHDEEACAAIARPFVKKMYETKFIHQMYWWRIAEAFMDELESHHRSTAVFSGREYGARAIRVVFERATKIAYNTMNEWSFASDDFVSPFKIDNIGHRAVHESGHW